MNLFTHNRESSNQTLTLSESRTQSNTIWYEIKYKIHNCTQEWHKPVLILSTFIALVWITYPILDNLYTLASIRFPYKEL